jgi:hypothetical protein
MNHDNLKMQRDLGDIVSEWEKHAGKYFGLAEREQDPLGQKFYQSSAMAYANCATAIRHLMGQAPLASHKTQATT